jgi:hypothetical protein
VDCRFRQYTNDQLGRCAVKDGVSGVLNKETQIARMSLLVLEFARRGMKAAVNLDQPPAA